MLRSARVLGLVTLAVTLLVVPLKASDPLGAYCIIQKVVLEPVECPERAQIWGACTLANPRNGSFQPPAKGYFYVSVPTGREEAARREWADLLKAAGTMEPIGFGGRYQAIPRLRATTEKPENPEVYPLNVGVASLGKLWPAPPQLLQQLRDLAGSK